MSAGIVPLSASLWLVRSNPLCKFAFRFLSVDSNMLQEIVPEKDGSKILSYVCGPSKMIDAMEKLLTDRNIDVRSEKWW